MRRTHLLCFAVAVMLASPAMADSISPGSMAWDLAPNTVDTFSVTKTVTVNQALSGDLDILFLFDASASMGDLLATTAGGTVAQEIVTELATAYGGSGDTVRFGVAFYQDFADYVYGVPDEVPYGILQSFTTDTSLATQGLQNLTTVTTSGHPSNDAESGLYALYQAAMDNPGLDFGTAAVGDLTTLGWDPLARKVLVWIGDAPNWDGDLDPSYPSSIGLNDALVALSSNNIIIEALSVGQALGLDGTQAPYNGGPGAGPLQATILATGTGGSVTDLTGIPLASITGTDLYNSIVNALQITLNNYGEVGLDVSEATALGLVVNYHQVDPDQGADDGNNLIYTGDYDRSETRTFQFDVEITAGPDAGGTVYTFSIYGLLNGNTIATELDHIYVGERPVGPGDVPEPSTIALMGLGLLGVGFAARRKLRK